MKPILYDLCCGKGGWAKAFLAAGWDVRGFDIDDQPDYPGTFHRRDVLTISGREFVDGTLIVASPPCEQFSRHQMPWTKRRNPPPPDLSIVDACFRIAREAGLPIVLENVRKAQDWLGSAKWHCGAYYLWGAVPALMPVVKYRKKESFGSSARLDRAMVPFELGAHIAKVFDPRASECVA